MIRRALIAVILMLSMIGSAQLFLPEPASSLLAQTEISSGSDIPSGSDNPDIAHAHDGDPWMRKLVSNARPRKPDLADIRFYPGAAERREGRMLIPMHRPPIQNSIAFSSRSLIRAA